MDVCLHLKTERWLLVREDISSVKVTSESLQVVSDTEQLNTSHLLCRDVPPALLISNLKKKEEETVVTKKY